jgi:dihydroflavonol-4-reductase
MTAVVTGGSGFVGGAVVRRLVAEGRTVRALVRSRDAAETVAALGATPVTCDLTDTAGLVRTMRGAEDVFHVAGRNTPCPRDPSALERDNVDAAVAVAVATARAGARRLIHTSSAATLGEEEGAVGHEGSPHRGWFLSPYERTKYLGERAVLAAARDHGLDVVVVNPCSVQGPGRATGSAELLLRVARARTAVVVRSWISVIDVDDCAAGHLRAAAHGVPGERYVLSGSSLPVDDALRVVRDLTGSPRRAVWIPRAIVRAGAPLTTVARLGSGAVDPIVCPAVVRTLLHGHRYDGTKAYAELGLVCRPFEETVARILAWARAQGLLAARSHG